MHLQVSPNPVTLLELRCFVTIRKSNRFFEMRAYNYLQNSGDPKTTSDIGMTNPPCSEGFLF